ncbi:SMI1/KNR4 family protein [Leptospira meyeri]|uniref:SMI1/KNR4 family protein n=1 Tax=Leptospira meyeri TaxID=29508 RepID=UPI00223CBD14|nr:SMI1/KNR4 family protein [Leptospira meyeri]MCW7490985.1 SMI1/KNR4 family protein [Leptospira meyeri]
MNIVNEFEKLVDWQNKHSDEKLNTLNKVTIKENFNEIEKIIEEKLPEDFIQLYSYYDGEQDEKLKNIFFGHKFLSTSEILLYFEFPKSLIKPKTRSIKNPVESDRIINEIKEVLITHANKIEIKNLSIMEKLKNIMLKKFYKNMEKKTQWNRIEISLTQGSFKGPELFFENGDSQFISDDTHALSEQLFELGKKLYLEEKETYNWDEILLVFHNSNKIEINRSDYDWDNETPFESIPKEKIKKRYFNIKWVPIFFDHGGNYIGIDLDPDKKGTKGQIIIYGRDEDKTFVLADSLNEFFEKINSATDSFKNKEVSFPLLNGYHIHSTLPELLKIS